MKTRLVPLLLLASCHGAAPQPETASSALVNTPAMPSPWATGLRENMSTASPLHPACPTGRWVGYMRDTRIPAACPAPGTASGGTWQVSKLFGPAPALTGSPDLDRFCIYVWNPTGTVPPQVSALPNVASMRLERDCRVVVPLGDEPTAAGGAELWDMHATALDLPTFGPGAAAPASRVRLAVVDSSPTELVSGLPSGQGHGLVVGTVARNTGCMDPVTGLGCPFVTSHQGLAQAGGDYGYQSDVARAILQAIRQFIYYGNEDRLVVNLSLGWEPLYGGGPGPAVRVPSYAVYAALQVAACQNVLVVAAAGNRARVDSGVGPMLPAGWEPADRVCAPTLAYAPLVHAIGGLTREDAPIGMSRAASQPRLSAPASLVTARRPNGTPTPILSGTSMSAASVAGIASLVWSFDPTLDPEHLMQLLYDHAVPLGVDADFEQGAAGWEAARVDACAAVREVTSGLDKPTCVPRAAGHGVSSALPSIAELESPGWITGPLTPGITAAVTQVVSTAPEVNMTPWAGPQPTKPPCPLCFLFENGPTTYFAGTIDLPEGRIENMYVQPCIDECDPSDPWIEVLGELSTGQYVKVEVPVDLKDIGSARLETKIEVGGETTMHTSEVAIHR